MRRVSFISMRCNFLRTLFVYVKNSSATREYFRNSSWTKKICNATLENCSTLPLSLSEFFSFEIMFNSFDDFFRFLENKNSFSFRESFSTILFIQKKGKKSRIWINFILVSFNKRNKIHICILKPFSNFWNWKQIISCL